MKKITPMTFCRKLFIFSMILSSIFFLGSIHDSGLCAQPKKSKLVKQKVLKRNYEKLKEDLRFTKESCVDCLHELLVINNELENKAKELEERVKELESICIIQNKQLSTIKDYLYQKELDPTYCPFDMLKKFYEDPIFLEDAPGERHILSKDG